MSSTVTPATVLAPDLAPPPDRPVGRRAARALGAACCLALAALLVAGKAAGWQALTVLTGSMRPTIDPGQVVVVSPTPIAAVRPGEVITFRRPGRPGTTTHRVVRVQRAERGRLQVTTKGDANPGPESWSIRADGTVGRLREVLPRVGGAVALLVAGPARPFFVAGITAIAALLVLWWVWRPDPTERDGLAAGRGEAGP